MESIARTQARRTSTVVVIMATTNTQLNITRTPSYSISSMTSTMFSPSISKTTRYSMPYLTLMLTHMVTTIPSMDTMALASSSEDSKSLRGRSKIDFKINSFSE